MNKVFVVGFNGGLMGVYSDKQKVVDKIRDCLLDESGVEYKVDQDDEDVVKVSVESFVDFCLDGEHVFVVSKGLIEMGDDYSEMWIDERVVE